MNSDSLTVLISVDKKHAGKQFRRSRDGSTKNRGYGSETHFQVESVAVHGIQSLARALERVSRKPFAFVIRGELLPGADPHRTLRRSVAKKATGEPATFAPAARHWFLVDVDSIACPAAIDPKSDPEGAAEYVIGLLPPELWDASCWCQWSSSQSVFSDLTLSLHLWAWSETPLDDAALTRWAIAANTAAGYKLIDPAPYRTVQPHYVAAPEFVPPLVDPLPRRYGLRRGLDETVSLIIPEPASIKHPEQLSTAGFAPGRGVAAYLAMIGGPAGFREPTKQAIASYIAIHGSKADCGPLKAAIRDALDRAEPNWRDDPKGARYDGDDHLDKLIEWTRTTHGDQPPRGFTPEPPPYLDEAPPHPGDNEAPEDEAPGIGPLPAEFSEEALALQFTAQHCDDWRYTALWGKWLQWLATRWRNEDTLRAFDLARAICRRNSAPAAVISDKLARDVCRAGTVAAIERLARADRRHAMTFERWDTDDWIINQPQKGPKA